MFEYGKDINQIVHSLPKMEIQHMHRVGKLVTLFTKKIHGQKYGEGCDLFGKAAFYHDIGKSWVPREVLLKPGRLTEKEKVLVYQHPLFAERLFSQVSDGFTPGFSKYLTQLMIQAAVSHHEWWDGTGYPYGIKENAIPFIARITSICDAYDAMSSNRVYRKAHTHEYACRQLEKNAGIQFDPNLIEIFLNNESVFEAMNKNPAFS
jgi:putative two-component system response regulator